MPRPYTPKQVSRHPYHDHDLVIYLRHPVWEQWRIICKEGFSAHQDLNTERCDVVSCIVPVGRAIEQVSKSSDNDIRTCLPLRTLRTGTRHHLGPRLGPAATRTGAKTMHFETERPEIGLWGPPAQFRVSPVLDKRQEKEVVTL